MKKKTSKHLIRKMMALSVAAVSTAAFAPFTANADCLGQNDFDDGIARPWSVFQNVPAEQSFKIEGGSYNVTIINPGGKERGGDSRWDLGIRHRNLHIEKDHKYKIHWEVNSSNSGELATYINDVSRNGMSYNTGVWQNNTNYWDQGWNNVKIEKGDNKFDSEFTADRTIEVAEWAFNYGGAGPYQYIDCFPLGTTLKFDNMRLECETCGEVFKDKISTPCLWDPSNEMGMVTPRSDVRINQVGYLSLAEKRATYATSEEKSAVSFVVKKNGTTVYEGKGTPIGFDKEAGEYCQILDFSEVNDAGTYTIEVDDKDNVYTNPYTGEVYKKYISHEFRIGHDIYNGILTDAMNYYYQNRSDEDITETNITSFNQKDPKGKHGLAHSAFHKKDKAYIQSKWIRSYEYEFDGDTQNSIDATGGWYTGYTYTKNVISGANTVWLLQNMYERSKVLDDPNEESLREARYELEWMFKMIVDPEKDSYWGKNHTGFVYHEVNDHKFIDFDADPMDYQEKYKATRIVRPPTYAATFNMIACAAQASRLWKGIDDDFAAECLEKAEASWKAVMKYQSKWAVNSGRYESDPQYAPNMYYIGTALYDDNYVQDEAYWAACELFSTTGSDEYYDYLKAYNNETNASGSGKAFDIELVSKSENTPIAFFDDEHTASMGTLSLYLSDKTSDMDKEYISDNIIKAADILLEREYDPTNGMGLPYKQFRNADVIGVPGPLILEGYAPSSNAYVANNAIIMGYAYDAANHDMKYLNGSAQALDYLFGRNGLGISYVTGYGTYHTENPTHRYWKYEIDNDYPMAPSGVLVCGPNSLLEDDHVKGLGMRVGQVAPQKCYADSVEAWSSNDTSPQCQAALIWNLNFLEDGIFRPVPPPVTTTTTTTTAPPTVTTTTTTVPDDKPIIICDKFDLEPYETATISVKNASSFTIKPEKNADGTDFTYSFDVTNNSDGSVSVTAKGGGIAVFDVNADGVYKKVIITCASGNGAPGSNSYGYDIVRNASIEKCTGKVGFYKLEGKEDYILFSDSFLYRQTDVDAATKLGNTVSGVICYDRQTRYVSWAALTSSEGELCELKLGDTNCDGTIELADAILTMQSLANPNKYGLAGTAPKHLTEQGKENGDVDKSTEGLTSNDALRIQEYLLNKKVSFDTMY